MKTDPQTIEKPTETQAQSSITSTATVVLKCIQAMNTEALYYLLDQERSYQDWQRNEFILKLEYLMRQFKADGDTYLNAVQGSCGGNCSKGQNGYLFIGNNSKNYMNLLFVEDQLELQDLYECSLFRTNFTDIELKQRYYIDPKTARMNRFFEEFNKQNNSNEPF